jgi:acyl-CoA synthetase (NDP forming)
MRDLSRLLRPRSIALVGGAWAENVAVQLRRSGFGGPVWPVNPVRDDMAGYPCCQSLEGLPGVPDAVFVGVNRGAAVGTVAALSAMGAGGAICFAAGFAESDVAGGADLQDRLVAAAGAMPLLGPNCYGMLNYLDRVTLWPDVHGGVTVDRGVALISQSSNIAVNLTMQARGLPLAYVLTAGNQAQTGIADLGRAVIADPRVTALGLYVEGFGDIRAIEAMAAAARARGLPVVVVKAGRTDSAQAAALTHTASIAGSAAASSALLARLGLVEVGTPAALLGALALAHQGSTRATCGTRVVAGPAGAGTGGIVSVSCSGGEASLMADAAAGTAITYPPFPPAARAALHAVLGPMVTIANPLDYHTFIWGDTARMTDCFAAAMSAGAALTVFVLDLPRTDRTDPSGYRCAVEAIIAARARTGARVAVLASLPETMPESLAAELAAHGIAALAGLSDGIAAIDAVIRAGMLVGEPTTLPPLPRPAQLAADPGNPAPMHEAAAKALLAAHGVAVPRGVTAGDPGDVAMAARSLRFPLALKGQGAAHKTEAGLVAVNLNSPGSVLDAARSMRARGFLAEEMVTGAIAELIVGVTRDATGLMLLTIGAGGVLAELIADSASLILPVDDVEIRAALGRLRIHALLAGHRGRPAADMGAVVAAIRAIAAFAEAHAGRLAEVEVNPLIVTPAGAVAADALIRLSSRPPETCHGQPPED